MQQGQRNFQSWCQQAQDRQSFLHIDDDQCGLSFGQVDICHHLRDELRSKTQNINKIAVKYGGGGHIKASGAMVKDKAEAMAMLDDLDKMQIGEQ